MTPAPAIPGAAATAAPMPTGTGSSTAPGAGAPVVAAPTAAAQGIAACHVCGRTSPVSLGRCPRCETELHLRKPHSLERTWAFLAAAVVLYFPANFFPIMTSAGIRGAQSNTILSGVATFWEMKAYPVASVIFTASVLIPLLKVVSLVWLCLAASGRVAASPQSMSRIYHVTELLGRWSMVDVFVVAVLACLVRFGSLMTITPGPAALSFAGVVIFTMLSAMSFDPRLIWDRQAGQTSAPPEPPR